MERLLRLRASLIFALLAAALAAEPVLGPSGWTVLGPLPPTDAPARDQVIFDPATCAVEVSRVDLDGGPANRDVRLARVWTDGGWRWADDWVVRDGRLLRPGRAPVPAPSAEVGGEVLTLDPGGRVVARGRAGRVLEVLRDAGGGFRGMRSGRVEVRIEGEGTARKGIASDGRTVRWRWEGRDLRSVAEGAGEGVASVYTYDGGGALSAIAWADGTGLAIDAALPLGRTRTRGVGGTWTCELLEAAEPGGRVRLLGPGGIWVFERAGDRTSVTDPTGGTTRTRWAAGRVAGWTDPRGGETRLGRDEEGRVTDVTDPSGARWELAWADTGLAAVVAPDGARWALTRDRAGAVVRVDEPSGRSAAWERDAAGRVRAVGVGAARWGFERDAAGRLVALADPVGSSVALARDAAGAVVRVVDGANGAWTLTRDAQGRAAALADPAGGRWEIVRDALGRATGVRDPTGTWTRWTLRDTGEPERLTVGGNVWTLLWSGPGVLAGLRDPLGRTTGWTDDTLGRARAVHRADGGVVGLSRDAAGDLVGVGDAKVRRDAAGRPLAVELGERSLYWDLDGAGRVVGVSGPGVQLGLGREPGGAIREVRVEGSAPVRLSRDGVGRVVRAEGDTWVELARDAAGRIVALAREGGARLRIERDRRGLPARLVLGDQAWTIGRDASGRPVTVDGGRDLRLGVDRDVAGRPVLARFPTGALARFEREGDDVRVALVDRDGEEEARVGWTWEPAGLLGRLQAEVTWLLRRDPVGTLVAAEAGDEVWSNAPDGVEGPLGAFVRYEPGGRPLLARVPTGWGGAWGLGEGDLAYELEAGAITRIRGSRGETRLRYDGVGRLVAWTGADGGVIARDALGRLAAIGRTAVEGWEGLRTLGGDVRAALAGIAVARPDGGVLLAPSGTPLVVVHAGPVRSAPSGALGTDRGREAGAAGRLQAARNGPLLGLADGLDPVTGQSLAAEVTWPWAPRAWEPTATSDPLADPDGASLDAPWDPAPWAPRSPWSNPLALLVEADELPDGGPRAASAPGVPWLPASLAPERPAPVPDPFAIPDDEEALVAWILGCARAPTTAARPSDVSALLLGGGVASRARIAPGLAPLLPAELRGIE